MQEEKEKESATNLETKAEEKPKEKVEEKAEESDKKTEEKTNNSSEAKKSEKKPEEKTSTNSSEPKKQSTAKMESPQKLSGASSARSSTFSSSFKNFSKFGDIKSDGKHITLSQSDKWMKQAKVLDKKITTTDTAIIFKKQKSMKLSMEQYKTFLEDLAKNKKVELPEIMDKMANCGSPGVSSSTAIGSRAASTVDRLTDVTKYTGAHKNRFNAETGKGKGAEGRKDVVDNSGYVQGYKDKDTKH